MLKHDITMASMNYFDSSRKNLNLFFYVEVSNRNAFDQDHGAYKHKNARIVFFTYIFSWNKYLRQPSIDFDFAI
jgi:hypothetical protein